MGIVDKRTLKNEIITCGKDPVYFINKYVTIKHPVRGAIPFKMFPYQEDLVRSYQDNRFNIVLKARQLGISEVTAAYATWLILFHRTKNVIVVASKAETAKNMIKKVAFALKKLPKWLLLADVTVDNRLSIELSNGSRIAAIASSGDAGRSEAVSFLIVDEAAFVPNFDTLWTGLYPTVSAGGSAAVMSTPNGVGNKFHSLYSDAENDKNEFVHHKFMWYLHPEHIEGLSDDDSVIGGKTSPWFKNEVESANMGPREVAQELCCNFNASGDTVFPQSSLKLVNSGVIDPLFMRHWDRNLWIWMPVEQGRKYFTSADVSRGDGKDYSAFIVWDSDTMSQAAEYYGKIPVEEFAKLLCDVGTEYNSATLIVENSSIGHSVLEHIRLLEYPNVYYSKRGNAENGAVVDTRWEVDDKELVAGFTTSAKVRPLMISKFEEWVRNRSVFIKSKRLHGELLTFVWNNGRAEAMSGKNDDLVLACSIGCWMKDTFIGGLIQSAQMSETLLNSLSVSRTMNNQIPGASKNSLIANQNVISTYFSENDQRLINSQRKLRLPNGQIADISWLYNR